MCEYCGQIAGRGSTCPVYDDPSHGFKEMVLPVYCEYCGAIPGKGSICPIGSDERHVFKKVNK